MDLFDRFNDFILEHHLLPEGQTVLLAVSGGIDSVVMAQLFRRSGRPFALAHCNFQLRGEESEEDMAFVQALALSWRVPFWVERFDTTSYAREHGLSIQMAARDLRYAWFEALREEHRYGAVAVAHTLNDSVETALLNFVRGTGLAGLTGISRRQNGIIRPLLFAARAEVEAYALELGLHWREDSSNQSDAYARNFMRHQVLPLLEELNPNVFHTAGRNLQRLRDVRNNYAYLLKNFVAPPGPDARPWLELSKAKLSTLPARREALLEFLRPYGFTDEQCRQLDVGWDRIGLELTGPLGMRVVNERDCLRLTSGLKPSALPALKIEANDLMVALPDGTRLVLLGVAPDTPFPDGLETALVDGEKLEFPLLLRPWLPGDQFQPLGMQGRSQKLQDFFTNHKLSKTDKDATWILVNGDGAIIWVLGWRPDERFKITPASRQALKLQWIR